MYRFGIANNKETDAVVTKYPVLLDLMENFHGSGVDYDWNALEGTKHVTLTNSFHAMNEAGMYVAVVPFSIQFPLSNFMDYTVHGDGSYWWRRNNLHDHISDTIWGILADYIEKNKDVAPLKSGVLQKLVYELVEVKA